MDINATIIGQTIAMIVFVWFCMKFVWPLIIGMLEERQNEIAEGLAAADKGSRALEEAEAEKAVILDEARGQAREIIDQANTRANHIVEEARTEAGSEKAADSGFCGRPKSSRKPIGHAKSCVARLALSPLPVQKRFCSGKLTPMLTKSLLDKLAAEI